LNLGAGQAAFIAALLAWSIALAAGTVRALAALEAGTCRTRWLPAPLGPLVALIAHYARGRLRLTWRAAAMERLLQAGVGARIDPAQWFAFRAVLALAGAAAGAFGPAVLPRAAPAAVVLGWLAGGWGPELWLAWRAWRWRWRVRAQLPLLLEMLLTGVESGLGFRAALQLAAAHLPRGGVRAALERALAEAPGEVDPERLWRRLALGLREPRARRTIQRILRAREAGTGLAHALYGLLGEQGRGELRAAEERARRAPWQALRPVWSGFGPALVLLWAAPWAGRWLSAP